MAATGWWAEILSFSVSATTQKVRAAFSGSRTDPVGTAAPKAQPLKAALTGVMPPVGAESSTLQRSSFIAVSGLDAAIGTTLQRPISALTGSGIQQGTAAASTQNMSTAWAGTQTQSGSMAASVAKTAAGIAGTQTSADVQLISGNSDTTTSLATMPAHATGDLLMGVAYSANASIVPATPAGWTTLTQISGANPPNAKVAYKVAASSSETSGTWTSASHLFITVFRSTGTPSNATTNNSGAGTTMTYPALTRTGTTPNKSWIMRTACHRTATNMGTNTPAGYTARMTNGAGRTMDTNGPVSSNPVAQTQSVNSTGGWCCLTIEIPGT